MLFIEGLSSLLFWTNLDDNLIVLFVYLLVCAQDNSNSLEQILVKFSWKASIWAQKKMIRFWAPNSPGRGQQGYNF